MQQVIAMTVPESIAWIMVGIIFSLVLPVAVKQLKTAKGSLETKGPKPSLGERIRDAWTRYGGTKYSKIVLAAAVVAAAIVGILGLSFYHVRDAVIAGFAWESFVSKLADTQKNTANQVVPPPGKK